MKPERKPGLPSSPPRLEKTETAASTAAPPGVLAVGDRRAGRGARRLPHRLGQAAGRREGAAPRQAARRAELDRQGLVPAARQIEGYVVNAANRSDPDAVDHDASTWSFRTAPGLYLRLRVAEARDVASVRRATPASQKDGFVGCLLREPNTAAAKGEADAGAFAEQPWNWQKAYAATRILSDEWVTEVKDSPEPLRLRIFEEQYEKAVTTEIPLAIDIVKKAQFFLLVLDEDSDEARLAAEGGAVTEADAQRTPHYARVHLYNLKSGKEVLHIRRSAEASFFFAGEHQVTDPETLDAMKRQVNNCALAKEVDKVLAPAASP